MMIYKYFSFDLKDLPNDKKLESFRENYLWFSKPKFFNDPFDCNMAIINHYNKSANEISKTTKDILINSVKEFGICCFSKRNDSMHMWSHYTDSHKGVCIEYDSSNFDDYFCKLLNCKCLLKDVEYRDELINLDGDIELEKTDNYTRRQPLKGILQSDKDFDLLLTRLLLQKNKKNWSQEEELRLIIDGLGRRHNEDKEFTDGYKIPIERNMIKSVIFGYNAQDELKAEVKKIFNNEVTYKKVSPDFEKWGLKIEDM